MVSATTSSRTGACMLHTTRQQRPGRGQVAGVGSHPPGQPACRVVNQSVSQAGRQARSRLQRISPSVCRGHPQASPAGRLVRLSGSVGRVSTLCVMTSSGHHLQARKHTHAQDLAHNGWWDSCKTCCGCEYEGDVAGRRPRASQPQAQQADGPRARSGASSALSSVHLRCGCC